MTEDADEHHQSDVKRLKIKKPSRNAEIQTDSSALDHTPSKTRSAHVTSPSLPSEASPSSASPPCSQTISTTPSLPSVVTDNAHVHVTVSTANPFLALANEEHTDGNNAKLAAHEHEGRTVLVPTELRPVNSDGETGNKLLPQNSDVKEAEKDQHAKRSPLEMLSKSSVSVTSTMLLIGDCHSIHKLQKNGTSE